MGMNSHLGLDTLIISRPELQGDLTDVIPLGQIPWRYINRYLAEEEVRCAFCEKHTPHKRGFTAEMEDGRIALCGRDCAAKYFGKDVADRFEKDLERQIQVAARRRLVKRTIDGVAETLAKITPDMVEKEKAVLDALHGLFLDLRAARLPTILTDAGDLEITESRRRWIERVDENGIVKRVPVDETRVTHRIAAAGVLRVKEVYRSHFESARAELMTLAEVKTTDDWSEAVIDRMVKKRSKIIADIQNAVRFMNLCQRFFTKDNIRELSRLAVGRGANVEKLALHKTPPEGWNLVVTRMPKFFDVESQNMWTDTRAIPDLSELPDENDLLKALTEGATEDDLSLGGEA
jgi:hypothetical protein